MQLNHDLIRDLLIAIEQISNGRTNFPVEYIVENHLSNYDLDEVVYHVKQLAQAKLIEVPKKSSNHIIDLTWYGHQYVASIKDQSVWKKVKKLIEPLGGATLEVIMEISKNLVTQKVRNWLNV